MNETSLTHSGFSSPIGGNCDILIIAGEHSGDQHAAKLVEDLKKENPQLNICALGGVELKNAGAQLLYDLTAVSVVGFVEVLKHYSIFKDVFEKTLSWIRHYQPKKICLVDYPGFNLRLAARMFHEGISLKGGGDLEVSFYIGPQIWAWKGHRRFRMAEVLDKLSVIFPFEIDCYSDTKLPVTFVGHPFLRSDYELPLEYDPSGSLLLLPGSRRQAVQRIFPVLLKAFRTYLEAHADEKAIVVYPDDNILSLLKEILRSFDDLAARITFVSHGEHLNAKAVLMSSGTMSLKCALAGIPGAIVYRTSFLTNIIGRILIRIPYLGIANILLNKEVYPEYIQWDAKSESLCAEIDECLNNKMRIEAMEYHRQLLQGQLKSDSTTNPAAWLLS